MRVYLEDNFRRAGDAVIMFQHLVCSFPLLGIGFAHLHEVGGTGAFSAWVEIAIASAVLGTFLWEARRMLRHDAHAAHSHSHVGWFDMAAGGLLLYEALHGEHLKPVYARAHFYEGTATIMIGVMHKVVSKFKQGRRYMEVDAVGFDIRHGPRRRSKFAWAQLAAVETPADAIVLRFHDGGTKKIGLRRFANREAARQLFLEHARVALAPRSQQASGGEIAQPSPAAPAEGLD